MINSLICVLLFLISGCLSQTQEEIYDFVLDHTKKCGDPFDETEWFPAIEFCAIACTNTQLCKLSADEEMKSKCFDLPTKCADALKDSFGGGKPPATDDSTTPLLLDDTTPADSVVETTPSDVVDETTAAPDTGDEITAAPDTKDETTIVTVSVDETTTAEDDGVATEAPDSTDSATTSDDTDGTDETDTTQIDTSTPSIPGTKRPINIVMGTGKDLFPRCCIWAAKGACDYNKEFMSTSCQKSCGTYACERGNKANCQRTIYIDHDECLRKNAKYPVYPRGPNGGQYPDSSSPAYPDKTMQQYPADRPAFSESSYGTGPKYPTPHTGLPHYSTEPKYQPAVPQLPKSPYSTGPKYPAVNTGLPQYPTGPKYPPAVLPLSKSPYSNSPKYPAVHTVLPKYPVGSISRHVRRLPESPHSAADPQCPDKYSKCSQWASNGECSTNEYWMKTHCQMSCNCCGCTLQSLLGVKYNADCKDDRKLCPFWASTGECTTNSDYMAKHCQASCRHC